MDLFPNRFHPEDIVGDQLITHSDHQIPVFVSVFVFLNYSRSKGSSSEVWNHSFIVITPRTTVTLTMLYFGLWPD